MWNFSSDEGRVAEESFGEKLRRINYKLITLNTLKNTEYEGWIYCFVSVNKKRDPIRCILYLCLGVRQQPPIHSFESTSVTQCHHMPLLLWDAATINFAWVDFLFVMDPGWTSQGAASLPPHLRCGQLSTFLLAFPNLPFVNLSCVSFYERGQLG